MKLLPVNRVCSIDWSILKVYMSDNSTKVTIWLLALLAVLEGAAWGAGGTRAYLNRPDAWYDGEEAARIAENILSWQSEPGGWPKNQDVTAVPFAGDRAELHPTFDNRATTDELRFLAHIYEETGRTKYRRAFERGYDHILKAQYPTGGWPQFYPPSTKYHRHITFNDDAMVRLLNFLRETCEEDRYDFIGSRRRKAAVKAFRAGIDCILKCQIRVDGRLTAWCAQHDELDYSPRSARAFELTSISGSESAGIVRLLMSLDKPGPRVVTAVNGAAAWFEEVALHGIRVDVKNGDRVIVEDASAPPLWARFYEIGSNRPIYCGRDGVKKYGLDEIDSERRNGYSWLGNWPRRLMDKEYPAWKKRLD